MKLNITASDARKHTAAFKEISKKLGNDITWTYDWCQTIQSTNIEDIFSGKAQKDAARNRKKTLEERVAEVKPNIHCSLMGKVGRKRHSVMLDEVPEKVLNQYRTSFAENIAEEQRIDGLTEEQRQAEVAALLKELGHDPGFFVIGR